MSRTGYIPLFLVALAGIARPVRSEIVINEIMYNSTGTPDVEYVELYNSGPLARDLAGWYLLDDDDAHDPCPLAGTLQPGAYLVVAGDLDLFTASYPSVDAVNPNAFGGDAPGAGFGLGNSADVVRLFDDADSLIDGVAYQDGGAWPAAADGDGASLELLNPALDNAMAIHWGASVEPGGTPGEANSILVADPPPVIGQVTRDVELPGSTDSVGVVAVVTDDQALAVVELVVDAGSGFEPEPMFDDGLSGDGEADDGVWGGMILAKPSGTLVRYYVTATDAFPQTVTNPAGAPETFFAYTVDHTLPELVISEILASNDSGLTDEAGEADDWLEIKNRGPSTLDLGGMYLTDTLADSQAWEIPSVVLEPGERLLVWCDGDLSQGPFHAAFTLSKEGGEIGLFDSVEHGNARIDGFTYGPQSGDVAFGLLPEDADAPEYIAPPTPAAPNDGAGLFSPVCINEFLAGSQIPGLGDWVELYNRSGATVNVGGWKLSDGEPGNTFTIPSPTLVQPGDFLSFEEAELGFAISLDGSDRLELTDSDGQTGRDYFDLGPQSTDVSQGRFPDGTANWHFFSPTRELANSCEVGVVPLDPVVGLRFAARDALVWDELGAAAAYDVLQGDLGLLRAGAGFAGASSGCVENNRDGLEAWVGGTPAAGDARFFLVRGVNFSCGFGTYDSGGATQIAPRDPGIQASGAGCF